MNFPFDLFFEPVYDYPNLEIDYPPLSLYLKQPKGFTHLYDLIISRFEDVRKEIGFGDMPVEEREKIRKNRSPTVRQASDSQASDSVWDILRLLPCPFDIASI